MSLTLRFWFVSGNDPSRAGTGKIKRRLQPLGLQCKSQGLKPEFLSNVHGMTGSRALEFLHFHGDDVGLGSDRHGFCGTTVSSR